MKEENWEIVDEGVFKITEEDLPHFISAELKRGRFFTTKQEMRDYFIRDAKELIHLSNEKPWNGILFQFFLTMVLNHGWMYSWKENPFTTTLQKIKETNFTKTGKRFTADEALKIRALEDFSNKLPIVSKGGEFDYIYSHVRKAAQIDSDFEGWKLPFYITDTIFDVMGSMVRNNMMIYSNPTIMLSFCRCTDKNRNWDIDRIEMSNLEREKFELFREYFRRLPIID